MANEKNYDYFVLDIEQTSVQRQLYLDEVATKREEVIRKLYSDTGAIAHTEASDMRGGNYISTLAFPADSATATSPHMKVYATQQYEGQTVVKLTGKGNRKEGIALNRQMSQVSQKLQDLPDYVNWVIARHNAHRGCIGTASPNARGIPYLKTYGGHVGKEENNDIRFVIAIPNRQDKDDNSARSPLPDMSLTGFEKITYGQFYDLENS
jgi:hypothetical protein